MRYAAALSAAFVLASAAPVFAKKDPVLPAEALAGREEAQIPFASSNGIQNWEARREAGKDVLYVEGLSRQWYRATLLSRCNDLQYANAIGFETRGTSQLDRFSTILVSQQGTRLIQRCPFTSLVKLTPEEAVQLKLRGKPKGKTAPAAPAPPETPL